MNYQLYLKKTKYRYAIPICTKRYSYEILSQNGEHVLHDIT